MPRKTKNQEVMEWVAKSRVFIFSVTLKRSGAVLNKGVIAKTEEIATRSLRNSETMGEIESLTLIEKYDNVQAAV